MFQGFSQATNDFLWGIRFNNERPWFEAHKQTYLDHVQTPMRQLAQEVYEKFSARHEALPLMVRVSRIYRDARRPYKSHLWFSLRMAGDRWAERPVLWFEIYPAGYAYGMGIYEAKPATMARFRQDMDEHPQTMMKLARAFQKQTRFRLEGERRPAVTTARRVSGGMGSPVYRRTLRRVRRRESSSFIEHTSKETVSGYRRRRRWARQAPKRVSPAAAARWKAQLGREKA